MSLCGLTVSIIGQQLEIMQSWQASKINELCFWNTWSTITAGSYSYGHGAGMRSIQTWDLPPLHALLVGIEQGVLSSWCYCGGSWRWDMALVFHNRQVTHLHHVHRSSVNSLLPSFSSWDKQRQTAKVPCLITSSTFYLNLQSQWLLGDLATIPKPFITLTVRIHYNG